MNDNDSRYNDADIEITDLDDAGESARGASSIAVSRSWRWMRGHRQPLTGASAALVVLALLLILVSSAAVRGLIGGIIARYNPAPTSVQTFSGQILVNVKANPPWGELFIDGRAITRPAPAQAYPAQRIARGRHIFTWRAAPFRDMQCALSVPPDYASDTCASNIQFYSYDLAVFDVTMTDILNDLPDDQQVALVQATQQALDKQQSSDIVQPGEQYVLATEDAACWQAISVSSCYAVAKQPLRANLSLQLDVNPNSSEECIGSEPGCTFMSQSCFLYCLYSMNVPSRWWPVLVPVRPSWTFATMEGSILGQDVPDNRLWDAVSQQSEDDSLLALHIAWDSGGWHVAIPEYERANIFDPACASAEAGTQLLLPPLDAEQNTINLQWQFASGQNPAAGCIGLGALDSQQFVGLTPPAFQGPYILHRFGAVLAANSAAHRLWPQLPLVDAHEQRLMQQLSSLLNGSQS